MVLSDNLARPKEKLVSSCVVAALICASRQKQRAAARIRWSCHRAAVCICGQTRLLHAVSVTACCRHWRSEQVAQYWYAAMVDHRVLTEMIRRRLRGRFICAEVAALTLWWVVDAVGSRHLWTFHAGPDRSISVTSRIYHIPAEDRCVQCATKWSALPCLQRRLLGNCPRQDKAVDAPEMKWSMPSGYHPP